MNEIFREWSSKIFKELNIYNLIMICDVNNQIEIVLQINTNNFGEEDGMTYFLILSKEEKWGTT